MLCGYIHYFLIVNFRILLSKSTIKFYIIIFCHIIITEKILLNKSIFQLKSLSQSFGTAARTNLVDCIHGAGSCDPSSLTKPLISQSVLCAFASAFTLVMPALFVKCRRTLKGTLEWYVGPNQTMQLSFITNDHTSVCFKSYHNLSLWLYLK